MPNKLMQNKQKNRWISHLLDPKLLLFNDEEKEEGEGRYSAEQANEE